MREFVFVGVGGFLGAVLRWSLASAVARWQEPAPSAFPLATLVVNVAGCLALGLVLGAAEARGTLAPATRAFLVVGVLGGFTTFSAFGGETFHLLRSGAAAVALASITLQLLLGIGAVAAGYVLARAA